MTENPDHRAFYMGKEEKYRATRRRSASSE
jgi:hypothetical protein